MKRSLVYLCGPIAGLTSEEARNGWRLALSEMLNPDYIEVVSPMRAEPDIAAQQRISGRPEAYQDDPLLTAMAITSRDRMDVMRSDFVVANLMSEKVSIGSMIELGWADMQRKPIIAILSKESPHWHVMVNSVASVIVPDLKGAAHVLNTWASTGL